MRVLYFTRDYTPHDHRFLSALAGTSHQVFSLRLERRGMQREDRPLPAAIEQVIWRGGKAPASWKDAPGLLSDLKRVIRAVQPDLIHAGSIQTAAFLTALLGFKPLVSMSWGSDVLKDANRNPFWHWATQFTLRRTSVLVDDCRAVSNAVQAFGFPAERIVSFPWGVDLEQFCPNGEGIGLHPGDPGRFVLLSMRSWEPIYGIDVLVKGFAIAARQVPELHLIMVGGGSQAGLVRRILSDHQLMDRVTLAGQVPNHDLPRYYRSADLYLSASYSDGSSVSLMEALACGLPALVSDIPGNLEWITPEKEGWLFKTGDENDLAQRIVFAARQLAARKRTQTANMRAEARSLAERRADWKKNFAELLRAYEMAAER